MEGVIGYTTLFAGNFAPYGWAFCQGQIIAIASNTALFSILGTFYGGNGTTTFALPDLQGRMVIGAGQGNGLPPYDLGESGGAMSNSMTLQNLAAHAHPVMLTPGAGANPNSASPGNAVYATGNDTLYNFSQSTSLAPYNVTLDNSIVGNGVPFSTLHPVMGMSYVICMRGVYPARN